MPRRTSAVGEEPMSEKRPFVEDGSQYGVSRGQFRRMRKDEKRYLMVQWFYEHFDHPDNVGTPWDEGEYLWIWGGPYDAAEQLGAKFGDVASEKLIEEVVKEVESEGTTDWGRRHTPEDREDQEDEGAASELTSLDTFSDEPSSDYGTSIEYEARERARAALDEVQKALDQIPVGIGHNRPPEKIEPDDYLELVRPAVVALRLEFSKPNPIISRVKAWAKPLREVLVATARWTGRKIDTAVDAGMKVAGTAGAVWLISQIIPPLSDAFAAIVHWLEIAAKIIF